MVFVWSAVIIYNVTRWVRSDSGKAEVMGAVKNIARVTLA